MGRRKVYQSPEPDTEASSEPPLGPIPSPQPTEHTGRNVPEVRLNEPALSHPTSATRRAAVARTAQRQQGNTFLQQLIKRTKVYPPVHWSVDRQRQQALALPRAGVDLHDVALFLYEDPPAAVDLATVNGIAPNTPLPPGRALRLTGKKLTPAALRHLRASPKVPQGIADPEAFLAKKRTLDRELERDFDHIVKKLDESHYSDSDEGEVIAILRRWGEEKLTTRPHLYPHSGEYLDTLFLKLTRKTKDVGVITTQWTNYYSLIFNHFDRVDEVVAIRDRYSRNFKQDRGIKEMSFGSFFWEQVKEGRIRDQIFAYFRGLADAGVGFLKGLKMLVTEPGKVLEAIGKLPETLSLLWKHRKELWQEFVSASPEEQARMIGRLFGEIEILIATVGAGGGTRAGTAAPQLATATAVVPGRAGTAALALKGARAVSIDLTKLGTEGARMTALTNQLGGASEAAKQKAHKLTSEAKAEAAVTKSKAQPTKAKTQPETVEEYLKRGGKIKRLEPGGQMESSTAAHLEEVLKGSTGKSMVGTDEILARLLSRQGTLMHEDIFRLLRQARKESPRLRQALYTEKEWRELQNVLEIKVPWKKGEGPDILVLNHEKKGISVLDPTRKAGKKSHIDPKLTQMEALRKSVKGKGWTVAEKLIEPEWVGKKAADVVNQILPTIRKLAGIE